MDNNDILIRLRYALDIKNNDMVEIFKLGGIQLTKEDVQKVLTKTPERDEEEDEVVAAPHESEESGTLLRKDYGGDDDGKDWRSKMRLLVGAFALSGVYVSAFFPKHESRPC